MAILLERCQKWLMKLSQIRHLVDVAERGSLQASAEELGVSKAALLRSIRGLERELGTAVFERGRKAMILTSVGKVFVRRAAAAQRELERVSDGLCRTADPSTGLVSIGVCTSADAANLWRILIPFHERFPDVGLRISEGPFAKVVHHLRDGTLDIYVGPIWPHDCGDDLRSERLYDVARFVVGRNGHPLANAMSLIELAESNWIATSRWELDSLFQRFDVPRPNMVIEVETGLSMLSAAAASDALIVLSACWLPLLTQMGALTPFPNISSLPSQAVHVVRCVAPPLTTARDHLHDLIVQEATEAHR